MTANQYRNMRHRRKIYKPRRSAEHRIQVECVDWFYMKYPKLMLLAIPNGAKFGGDKFLAALEWARLEAEGAMEGAADLLLAAPSGDLGGLWIEMKTKRGKQEESQKRFERAAIASGYGYALARSLKEFKEIVNIYLEKGAY